jgi:hypothetical protein
VRLDAPVVANAYAYYNLSTGTIGTVGAGANSTGVEDYGGGWYRIWIAYTGGAASHYHRISLAEADDDNNYTGDGVTIGVYVWGAQHEDDGTVVPSSYIMTTTATATRVKDSLYRVVDVSTQKVTLSCDVLLGPTHNSTQSKTLVSLDDQGS